MLFFVKKANGVWPETFEIVLVWFCFTYKSDARVERYNLLSYTTHLEKTSNHLFYIYFLLNQSSV